MEWKGIRGQVLNNVLMKRYTSMKVGGPARYMVYPADQVDLSKMIGITQQKGIPYRLLGNGTNVIVGDKGLDEAIIRLTHLEDPGAMGLAVSIAVAALTARAMLVLVVQ